MGSARTNSEPHFRNLLPHLSFFNSVPSSFPASDFPLAFSPISTQSSSNRIYSSFPQSICHHSFPNLQVRNQMGKRKKKHKATVDVPFSLVFKTPLSLIFNSPSPLFLRPSHACFSNQQGAAAEAEHRSTLPLFCFFSYFPAAISFDLKDCLFSFFGLKEEP